MLTIKLTTLRMRVISSTGTRPAVSFTSTAATAKMKAATSTQVMAEDHIALQSHGHKQSPTTGGLER